MIWRVVFFAPKVWDVGHNDDTDQYTTMETQGTRKSYVPERRLSQGGYDKFGLTNDDSQVMDLQRMRIHGKKLTQAYLEQANLCVPGTG